MHRSWGHFPCPRNRPRPNQSSRCIAVSLSKHVSVRHVDLSSHHTFFRRKLASGFNFVIYQDEQQRCANAHAKRISPSCCLMLRQYCHMRGHQYVPIHHRYLGNVVAADLTFIPTSSVIEAYVLIRIWDDSKLAHIACLYRQSSHPSSLIFSSSPLLKPVCS